ncbi:MAG TPA: GNAT family N-acetyltransferase [Pyrinomonadaceae bacterium]|nr:GNAT family N-acetyltransferase [Pyrinomonadaceae bacterium]
MPADVQIKQFELSDREAVLAFLREAYPDDLRKSDPQFWDWHYLENPYTAADNVPLWIVKDGDRVVGQAATILVELKVEDEIRKGIWILDFVLLPEYRGQKLGKRLLLLARETYPTMLALGYNDQSGNVLRSLDWVTMGSISRYQKLLFPGYDLKSLGAIPPLRGLVNKSFWLFRARYRKMTPNPRYSIREVTAFDESFDDLWRRASAPFPCAIARNSRFLAWQFEGQPGKEFEVLGLYDQDLLTGYVVLFFRKPERGHAPPKAAITDICYDPDGAEEKIDELLKAALRLAIERRAGSLVTDIRDPRIEGRLKKFGFWNIKKSPPFMVYSPTRQELMYEPNNWFLTRADSDVSIFEDPNL